jgi:hypothetical protein
MLLSESENSENENVLTFECPHCGIVIQVLETEIFCHIFRHGVLKSTMSQINPHATKEECDYLVEHQQIYGCGKPFILKRPKDVGNAKWVPEICDYI